ncbi:thiol:disulfide interchange protein DsbA/DsbL [Vibrio sp. TRT 21S02]|uniref:thiol:disulfide interchange protein DsbA/DsbL n=1 Tax=Vibrio sp. TRT 21S02 TaxID=3418507 RepID=UPI003CE98B93
MKKVLSLFTATLAAGALLVGCSDTTTPKEGEQYQQLPANLSTYRLPQVTEVFSLNCGHCRKMEGVIPQLEELTSQEIGKVHVTFNESAQIGAMIFYTAVMQLNKNPDHEMMNELFAAVQMGEGSTLTERRQAIEEAFHSRNLVSPYELNEEQQKQLFKLMKVAQEVSVKGEINAVPTFIVNGKYMLLTSGHKDIESIANTINYLTKQ